MRRSRAQNAEPAMEHALVRLLLGLILLGVLFNAAINYVSRFYQEAVEVKEQRLAERFLISVRHVHREWLLTGKNQKVKLEYIVDDNVTKWIQVRVNRKGWPIAVDRDEHRLDCASLWRYFAKLGPQTQVEMAESELTIEQMFDECRYLKVVEGQPELIFSYQPLSGKVLSNHLKVLDI